MRPNVRMGGSMAGGEDEPSAVQAFSQMRTAGVRAAGQMIGESVSLAAQGIAQGRLNQERDRIRKSLERSMPRGYSFTSAPPIPGRSGNQESFDAIGRALGEIVGFNRGGQAPRSSGSGSSGPRTFWQPRGDDGWGSTSLGARGSSESMTAKAIAGFSFL